MATFSVVGFVKEEPEVLRVFIDHYRRIGADQIFLYYDGPIDHLRSGGLDPDLLFKSGVELIACDEDFGVRSKEFTGVKLHARQKAAYRDAHDRCTSDWLLACDADELVVDRIPVVDMLDQASSRIDAISILPAESVWGPDEDIYLSYGNSWFRRPFLSERDWARDRYRIYGPTGWIFSRGLAGHSIGKSFVRSRAKRIHINLHFAERDGENISVPAREIHPRYGMIELAHFDAINYERWISKFKRRRSRSGNKLGRRDIQKRLVTLSLWLGGRWPERVFRNIYCLNERQLKLLGDRQLLFQDRLFPTRMLP